MATNINNFLSCLGLEGKAEAPMASSLSSNIKFNVYHFNVQVETCL